MSPTFILSCGSLKRKKKTRKTWLQIVQSEAKRLSLSSFVLYQFFPLFFLLNSRWLFIFCFLSLYELLCLPFHFGWILPHFSIQLIILFPMLPGYVAFTFIQHHKSVPSLCLLPLLERKKIEGKDNHRSKEDGRVNGRFHFTKARTSQSLVRKRIQYFQSGRYLPQPVKVNTRRWTLWLQFIHLF